MEEVMLIPAATKALAAAMLICAPGQAIAQGEIDCDGTTGYRWVGAERVWSPKLCYFPEGEPEVRASPERLKQLYIESLPPEKQAELMAEREERAERRAEERNQDWQDFLDATGKSFD